MGNNISSFSTLGYINRNPILERERDHERSKTKVSTKLPRDLAFHQHSAFLPRVSATRSTLGRRSPVGPVALENAHPSWSALFTTAGKTSASRDRPGMCWLGWVLQQNKRRVRNGIIFTSLSEDQFLFILIFFKDKLLKVKTTETM